KRRRHIADTPGDHTLAYQTTIDVTVRRALRYQTARRFEPDKAAAGSRDTNRAGAIGRMRYWHHSGANCRCRPARRPAGTEFNVERISGRTKRFRFGRHIEPELWQVGLADDLQPSRFEARRQLIIMALRRCIVKSSAARTRAASLDS